MPKVSFKLFKYNFFLFLLLASLTLFLSFKLISDEVGLNSEGQKAVLLVDGFPQVPTYQDATLVNSSKDTPDGFLYEATWQSKKNISSVSNWYLSKVRDSDLEIIKSPANLDAQDAQLLVAKDGNVVYNFSFIKDTSSGNTNIIVQINYEVNNDEEFEE